MPPVLEDKYTEDEVGGERLARKYAVDASGGTIAKKPDPEAEADESKDLDRATDDEKDPETDDQNADDEASAEDDEAEDLEDAANDGFYNDAPDKKNGARGFISGIAGNKKKSAIGIGAGGGILAIFSILAISMPGMALSQIKNMFHNDIGGVQSKTYQMGRKMYYRRMLFFDQKGNFDGYKKSGIRGVMYQNRQSTKLTSALRENGYKINFDDQGKVASLDRLDRLGNPIPGQSIGDPTKLGRAWDIRSSGDLEKILAQVYPEESARWHGKMAKKLYNRWGLTRTNWIGDYLDKATGKKYLNSKELALRAALRQHLAKRLGLEKLTNAKLAEAESTANKDPAKDKGVTQGEVDAAKGVLEDSNLLDEAARSAGSLENDLLSDATKATTDDIAGSIEDSIAGGADEDAAVKAAGNAVKNVPGSLIKGVNILATAQTACSGRSAVNSIISGARVMRAVQLMAFGMSVLNIADAMENGDNIKSADVAILMTYLMSTDKNGNNMWGSAGMRYYTDKKNGVPFSMSKLEKEQSNRYSVGGGLNGTLARIMGTFDKYSKGGTVCSKVNSFFGNLIGYTVGIGAAVFSAGTVTATNIGFNIGFGILVNVARSIAISTLTPLIAGTLINGSEKGAYIGFALSTGMGVLSNANGANAGMMPLKKPQLKVAEAELWASQKEELSKKSLASRLFSPNVTNSLTSTAVMGMSSFRPINLISSPIASLANSLNPLRFFGGSALAASQNGDDACNDPDITGHDLAASPDCQVQFGIPTSMIEDPNYYPDKVDEYMTSNSYVDDNGELAKDNNGNLTENAQKYQAYLKQCTADGASKSGNDYKAIDVIHGAADTEKSTEFTGLCYGDAYYKGNPMFNMYRFYSYIGQTEADGLAEANL